MEAELLRRLREAAHRAGPIRGWDFRERSSLYPAGSKKQWVEAIQEYANITELDAATLNRLIKEIVVHERIDEDKTRHISIEIHFNLKPIPEVEQVTAWPVLPGRFS